jgi:hypothetical protein
MQLAKHIEICTMALLHDRIEVLGKLLSGKTLVPGSRLLMNAYQHRLNSSQPFDEIARPVTRHVLATSFYNLSAISIAPVGMQTCFHVSVLMVLSSQLLEDRQQAEDDLHVLGSIALSWCVKKDRMLKSICWLPAIMKKM